MKWKAKLLLGITILAGMALGSFLLLRHSLDPQRTITLRIAVAPPEQSNFVANQANSARFKYLVSKQAGVKPVLAQKLTVKAVPNSSLLEARVGVGNESEGQHYTSAFVPILQELCRTQAQITLVEHSIR